MTQREIISQIRSMHKLLSSDNTLNDRSILAELKTSRSLLIKRDTDKRKLFQSAELFTNIDCLEMEKVPLAECCEYTSDKEIAKSKHKLPKIGEGLFGLLVQQVASVDGMVKFKESTPMRYANILKLNLPTNNVFFWIYNNHLYVTNPNTKNVRVSAFFEEDVPNKILYPDCDCKPSMIEDPCMSELDKQFKCPGYLVEAVKSLTYEKLMKTYYNTPLDKTSNQLDEQSR